MNKKFCEIIKSIQNFSSLVKPETKVSNFINNKKAIYLTLITLMLLSLFILFLNWNAKLAFSDADKLKEERIQQMNALVNDIRIDAERALYISSFRTILGMTEYIKEHQTGEMGFDSEAQVVNAFKDIIVDGKYGIIELESMGETEGYVTLKQWKLNMLAKLNELGIDLIMDDPVEDDITTFEHSSAFELRIAWEPPDITLQDQGDPNLRWVLDEEVIETTLSIEGFEDPLYIIGSNNLDSNTIRKSPYDSFSSDKNGPWELIKNVIDGDDEIKHHIRGQNYTASPLLAPSFLQRFIKKSEYIAGNVVFDEFGIESFVFVPSSLAVDSDDVKNSRPITLDYVIYGYDTIVDPQKIITDIGYDCWFFITDTIANRYGIDNSLIENPDPIEDCID